MRDNFQQALTLVLKHEGGYSNHPDDKGGPTNLGVTIGTYRLYVNPNGTIDDLKKLTVAQAGIVYKKEYWDKVNGDSLPSGVDYAVFDFAVNSGVSRAVRYLQLTVGSEADGVMGPATLRATLAAKPVDVVNTLCQKRLSFLMSLRTWPTFGKGWGRRVAEVKSQSLQWAASAPAPVPVQAQKPVTAHATPVAAPVQGNGIVAAIIAIIAAIFGAKK